MISFNEKFRISPILCSCNFCLNGKFQNCENHRPVFVKEFVVEVADLNAKNEKEVDNDETENIPNLSELDLQNDRDNFSYDIAGERNILNIEEDDVINIDGTPKLDIRLDRSEDEIINKSLPSELGYSADRNEFFDKDDDYSEKTINHMFKLLSAFDDSNGIIPLHYDMTRTLINRFHSNSLQTYLPRTKININGDIYVLPIFSTKRMKEDETLLCRSEDNDGHWALLYINMTSKAGRLIDSLGPNNLYMPTDAIKEFCFSLINSFALYRPSSSSETQMSFENYPCKSNY